MELRSPKLHEYETLMQFLDTSLRPETEWSIRKEYPTALNSENLNNIRIIKSGDKILSHAVVRPLLIKTPIGIFKVATIGSVVTESAYRNQGLSRKVIEECVRHSKSLGCDFAILWTNLYDFYRKLNFELSGIEVSLIFDKPLLDKDTSGLRYIKGNKVDPAALHRLMTHHTVSTVRSIEDVRKYLQIPNSRVYTAWDNSGALKAYAIEGKGADLDGYIHEWGGGVSTITPLLNYIFNDQGQRPLNLIAPAHAQNLIQNLTHKGANYCEGYLGMIQLLNFESLFSKVNRHARQDLGVEGFEIKEDNGQLTLRILGQEFKTQDPKVFTQLLFGPKMPSEILNLDVKADSELKRVFPLRMWLWGWDSI